MKIEKIAVWFDRFAEDECRGVSQSYYQLAKQISRDEELLHLASHARERQPIPNLFLGAVHFLLLKHPESRLARYYPSIDRSRSAAIPFDEFKRFCIFWSDEIASILANRIVQTNALNRTAYLMPLISSLFPNGETVNLIDIGASAGLNLNLDLYEYHYDGRLRFGKSPVTIKTSITDGKLPKFTNTARIGEKIAVDQNPLDLTDGHNALWLKALIWPDATERFDRMASAIDLMLESPVQLIRARKLKEFQEIILKRDPDKPLVVFHTHVLYQFTPEERKEFRNMLANVAKTRDFIDIAVERSDVLDEKYGEQGIFVEENSYRSGTRHSKIVAKTNGHASWIEWLV